MNIGDTIYWLSTDGARICSGEVLLASTDKDSSGKPRAVAVLYDGTFHVRNGHNAWDEWYATRNDAYRAGIARHAKAITAANQAMISLVDSLNADVPPDGAA